MIRNTAITCIICALVCLPSFMIGAASGAQTTSNSGLVIPAYTAYSEPNPEGIEISEKIGATGWRDDTQSLVWYGDIKTKGTLEPSITLTVPAGETVKIKLAVGDQSSSFEVVGAGNAEVSAHFRSVQILTPGYKKFTLVGLSKSGATYGTIKALELKGSAADGAHFNLKERRNAASVHLTYPIPTAAGKKVTWFYNEVTVKKDPLWSYYMACGFKRGYFGIQVNSPTERRVIFSIWDSGNEGVDRSKVAPDDRVKLVAKGDGVVAGDFGNEGTGGHSHLVYRWKTGSTYKFLVSAEPEGTHTVYAGYFYFPEKHAWGLIAKFQAPRDGNYLSGLYSFNEDFAGGNGQKQRLAEFGNQWLKSADGVWTEITTAKFSHDGTGKADRLDYASGVNDGRFYLSNGGSISNGVKFGDPMTRPSQHKPPTGIELP